MKNSISFLTTLMCMYSCVQGFQMPFASRNNVHTSLKNINTLSKSVLLKNHVPARTGTSLNADPLDIMVTMYKDSLMDFPLATKCTTGACLAFIGDAIAQSREKEYDSTRAQAFVLFDIIYRAVQCSLFPIIVATCDGHFLQHVMPEADIHFLATMEQTFANQFLVIPLIYYPVFFTLTGYLQGLSAEANMYRAQTTILPLLTRNWLFWIPVQYFQFGYVDEPLQIPFLCVAGLAWTFILSIFAGSVQNYEEENAAPASIPVSVNPERVV